MTAALLELAREFRDKGAPELALSLPDALWLAQLFPPAQADEREEEPAAMAAEEKPRARERAGEEAASPAQTAATYRPLPATPPPLCIEPFAINIPKLQPERLPIGMLVPRDHPHAVRCGRGTELSIPAPPSLHRPQDFGRRLKSLRNFRRNPHKHLLDVERTVERICDERIWELVTRHPFDRCLNLTWIMDTGQGMAIWQQMGREMYLAFRDSGVFRDTQAYAWQVDEEWRQSFIPLNASGRPSQSSSPAGRWPLPGRDSLFVLFSDCSAGRWYRPDILRQLHGLGEQAQLLVVNPLPERMWGRTALGQAEEVDLRAPVPGAPARLLQAYYLADRQCARGSALSLQIVAVAADPEHLLGWSRFAAGRRAVYPGFRLSPQAMGRILDSSRDSMARLSAGERLQRFFRYASRAGRELARLLAAVPLITPRFIRLVRSRMMPLELEAGHLQDTEVLLSPLLRSLGTEKDEPGSEPVYDFHEGVRQLLLAQTPTARIREIFLHFVDLEIRADLARGASLGQYRAMLLTAADEDGPCAVHPLSQAPTELIMRHLGGEYRRLLDEARGPSLLRRLNTWLLQAEEARVRDDLSTALAALQGAEDFVFENKGKWGEAVQLLIERLRFYRGLLVLESEVSVLGQPFVESVTGMVLLPIEPGTFLMGSPKDEAGRFDWEGPRHSVTLSRSFWLGKYPVTQREYEKVMGQNPSNFKGGDRPVEEVSWEEAVEFCRKLTKQARGAGSLLTGYEFRLPTEAEWEYCCRAGSSSAYCYGSDEERLGDYAWYERNSNKETHEVGLKKANSWGLHDMHGNVWEWCLDKVESLTGYDKVEDGVVDPLSDTGRRRVFRGGGWGRPGRLCRSASRRARGPADRSFYLGFRVCLAPSPAGRAGHD